MSRGGKISLAVWAVLLALAEAHPASAQIVAPSGRTVFNRAVMVRCFARGDLFRSPAPGVSIRRFIFPCAAVWGFRRDTNLMVVAPFAVVDFESRLNGTRFEQTRSGLADALVLVQYDGFYNKSVHEGFTRLGGQFGVKLPTGRSGFTSDALDYVFVGIFSQVRGRHWLVTDSQFTLTTCNDSGVKVGNTWSYDGAYKFRISRLEGPNVFGLLEANGEVAGRTRINGTMVPDSGGHLLFLSPGLEFLPTRRLVLEFSLPIPVVRDLNGPQVKPRVSWIAGFRYLF